LRGARPFASSTFATTKAILFWVKASRRSVKLIQVSNRHGSAHAGPLRHGGNIRYSRGVAGLAAGTLVRFIVEDENFQIWCRKRSQRRECRQQHKNAAIAVEENNLAMRQRLGQTQSNRNVIAHSRVEQVAFARADFGPFQRRPAQSDDHQLIFDIGHQRF